MYRLRILSVGKTKESWLELAIEEYLKRLQSFLTIEFFWAKNDEQLDLLAAKDPFVIGLDSSGEMMDSREFSRFLMRQFELAHSRLTFVIGGPEGLPASIKKNSRLISLSPLTFTHQMVRLLLVEQLYRSFEIAKGSPYHK